MTVTFILTVAFDLVVAIEAGILLAAILFMKRMADVTKVESWKYISEESPVDGILDKEQNRFKKVPKNTLVYEINGPMFFGAADKFMNISPKDNIDVVILRMRSVPAMDVTALHALEEISKKCRLNEITLILSHVQNQPLNMMKKAGFTARLGRENFCDNIDAALDRAAELVV
jgi:SulP family sulfate permease